jgi:4-amino-4-deoxy-L-arabinose transferase-like glycosyltransferase
MSSQYDHDSDLFGAAHRGCSWLFQSRWDGGYIALLLLCGGVVYLQGLGRPVAIWDEAFYMTAAQFSVEHGYWLVPHVPYEAYGSTTQVGAQPFLLKPPLAIWLQMLSMELFGTSATGARLPAVGFTLLTAVLVYVLGRTIYSRASGFIAAVVLLTTHMIFLGSHGGRTAALDVPLLFFGTLAVSAAFLGVRRDVPRAVLLPVAGLALAAAILTKGFGAGVFALIALPLFVGHWRAFLSRDGLIAGGLAVAIPLAWFGIAGLFYGNILVDMLYEQVINRITGAMGTSPATFGFMKWPYFRRAPEKFDPWWYLLLAALVTVPLGIYRRRGQSRLGTETLFLCWWTLSVLGFFVVTGNHGWYLMPIVVPIGLLCGRLIDRGLEPSPEAAGLAVGLSLTLMHSPVVGRGIRFVTLGVLSPSPPVRFAFVGSSLGVLIAVVYCDQWLPVLRPYIDLTGVAGGTKRVFTVSLIILVLLQLPMAVSGGDATTDQKQLGQHVRTTVPPDATIYIHPSAHGPIYTFVFYAHRPLQETSPEQLHTDPDVQYALVEQSVVEKLRHPHERIGTMTAWKTPLVLIEFNDPAQSRPAWTHDAPRKDDEATPNDSTFPSFPLVRYRDTSP